MSPSAIKEQIQVAFGHYQAGRFPEAEAGYRQLLNQVPNDPEIHIHLGNLVRDQGQLDEAIAFYRRASRLQPEYGTAESNLLYTLYFHPDFDARAIYEEHRRWDREYAQPLASAIQPHPNERSCDRPLRIGYVSSHFRNHCQSFFTVPLLRSHDPTRFQVYCYADVPQPDSITERLQSYASAWRNTVEVSDEELARMIRADQIDILVDLTMHMGGCRPLLFARKPAPIQVAWLAYPGTTGLSTMDYRITDPYLDPLESPPHPTLSLIGWGEGRERGLDDAHYSEKSIRLAESFWCYDPLTCEPEVNTLPACARGHVTFCCLNNFCKLNRQVLALWARVLQEAEGSRLAILAAPGQHREQTRQFFREKGIAGERLAFVVRRLRLDYLKLHHRLDIALDPFPANGHTTTLDALWMGVPVVTLAGRTAISRGAKSILYNLGLPELVAHTPEEYVDIAIDLAKNLPRLQLLRYQLRERMEQSTLMDAPRFARNMECAYRSIWRRWCGS
jgi:predicted O-linked N-acetylglucosamine transferase (SPINDLY family)